MTCFSPFLAPEEVQEEVQEEVEEVEEVEEGSMEEGEAGSHAAY